MKKQSPLSVVLLVLLCSSFTFTCDEYYGFHKGATFEFTYFNAKEKPERITSYHVDDVKQAAGSVKSMISWTGRNDKGKEEMKGSFELTCENDTYFADVQSFISEDQTKAYKDMQLKIVNKHNAEYPNAMTAGQKLKDAEVQMDILNKDGSNFGTMECVVSNRTVVGKESVTTPAGTYTAFQVSADISTKVKIAGVNIPVNFKSVDYFVPKFGVVKTVTYNKTGDKIRGSNVLTKYNR